MKTTWILTGKNILAVNISTVNHIFRLKSCYYIRQFSNLFRPMEFNCGASNSYRNIIMILKQML